ncbi:hypothetical protein V6C03_08655 [Methyloligella sp. 2.7D]|uniref:hypothetical protein n=1 Tax=unclassified Methyloligella TaxID=2625955 RepID=UPI00157BFC8C|nr:hypothetical protein [Methyloligella sp. GL2]QKP78061.1 hypothetical protein HT051_11795 [Methyloligella sp. GL2]
MKLAFLAAATLLIAGTGSALAAEAGPPLSDSDCQKVWGMTERDGDTLSKDKATDFVINYEMVDTDGSGDISADEFKKGCAGGWIKSQEGTDAE